MKKIILISFLIFAFSNMQAQKNKSGKYKTYKDKVKSVAVRKCVDHNNDTIIIYDYGKLYENDYLIKSDFDFLDVMKIEVSSEKFIYCKYKPEILNQLKKFVGTYKNKKKGQFDLNIVLKERKKCKDMYKDQLYAIVSHPDFIECQFKILFEPYRLNSMQTQLVFIASPIVPTQKMSKKKLWNILGNNEVIGLINFDGKETTMEIKGQRVLRHSTERHYCRPFKFLDEETESKIPKVFRKGDMKFYKK